MVVLQVHSLQYVRAVYINLMEIYRPIDRSVINAENQVYWQDASATQPGVTLTNVDTVIASLNLAIRTRKYERFFNPELGCPAVGMLFDLINDIKSNKSTIFEQLQEMEPRISIDKNASTIVSDKDRGTVQIELVFSIIGSSVMNKYTIEI